MKNYRSTLVIIGILSALTLSSCNEEISDIGAVDSLSSIVGIHDWSDDWGVDGIDEWYLGIDAEGYVSDYDYEGDSFDQGRNCYHVSLKWEKLTHISGNRFNTQQSGEVSVSRTPEGGLTIEFSDQAFDTITLGAKTSLLHSDLVAADCDSISANSLVRSFESKSKLGKPSLAK